MHCLQVTERGHSNWRELDLRQQHQAAAWAAEWLTRHRRDAFISDSVIRIGFGSHEKRHGRGTRLVPNEVVLTVTVAEKLPDPACGAERIPDYVQLRVPVDGGKRVLAIPTDVRVERPIPTVQADSHKVLAESGTGSKAINGSLCAEVMNTSGNTDLRYALTCHHVAFLSLLSPVFNPDSSAVDFHQAGTAKDTFMGKSSRGTRLVPSPQFSLDAALIRLDANSPARNRSFWSVIPTSWVKDAGELGLAFAGDARVYNRRMNGQRIEFSELKSDFKVNYSGGGTARFSQLIEYRLPSGVETIGGDSGGALVADRFNLIGMHIAGAGRIGYAIPAYQLFRSIAFTPSLTLATPEAS